MAYAQYASGYFEGGAARNIDCGFWPDYVRIVNVSDRDHLYEAHTVPIIEFDTGSTTHREEIGAGDFIRAADSGWSGVVREVVITAGAFSTDNATGYLILEPGSLEGAANIADNDVIHIARQKGGAYTATDVMVDDADGQMETTFITQTTVAAPGNDEEITYYAGFRGFSVQSAVGGANDLMYWQAFGHGAG